MINTRIQPHIRRVNLIGLSHSGKSTFAKALAARLFDKYHIDADILEEEFKDRAYESDSRLPTLYDEIQAFFRQMEREEARLRASSELVVINDSGLWTIVFYINELFRDQCDDPYTGKIYLDNNRACALGKGLSYHGGVQFFELLARVMDDTYKTLNIIFEPIANARPIGRWREHIPSEYLLNKFRNFTIQTGVAKYAEFVSLQGVANNGVNFGIIVDNIVDRLVLSPKPKKETKRDMAVNCD